MRIDSTFISRVVLRNFRSIAACDVCLGPLAFLVGQNGSGKSNFVDALRLVSDALNTSLDHALRDRGGVGSVRRKSTGHPTHFGIRLDFILDSGSTGYYAFRIGAKSEGAYEVQQEECVVVAPEGGGVEARFKVLAGEIQSTSTSIAPRAASDRLFLVAASGLREFRPVFDALSSMSFYSLNPDRIREFQTPDTGDRLERDGNNLPSVIRQMERREPEAMERVVEYLGRIVTGIEGVDSISVGPLETLEFRQRVPGARFPWRFYSTNMSDGTLRALGVLVALFQPVSAGGVRVPLVGIEEPEIALHPAAAGILLDALTEASTRTQVIVTSHSPDLLDNKEIDSGWILAFASDDGVTNAGRITDASRSLLRDQLYTSGELLRQNELEPAPLPHSHSWQPRLFGEAEQ